MAEEVVYVPKKQFSSKKETLLKLVVAVLLIVIIILIILVIGWFVSRNVNSNRESFCTSKECIQSASALQSTMDENFDPCDNFYKFACNNYKQANLDYVEPFTKYDNFVRVTNRVKHLIQRFLNEPLKDEDPIPAKTIKKRYIEFARVIDRRDELGYNAMDKYLAQAELPKVPTVFAQPTNKWSSTEFDWAKTSALLKKVFGMDLFLRVGRISDVVILMPSLRSPMAKGIFSDADMEDIQNLNLTALKKYDFTLTVAHVITQVLSLEEKHRNFKNTLNYVSEQLWNITITNLQERKLYEGFQLFNSEIEKISINDLQKMTDIELKRRGFSASSKSRSWKRYISTVLKPTGMKLELTNNSIYYLRGHLSYFISVRVFIEQIGDAMLEMYSWWKAVSFMIPYTTPEMALTLEALSQMPSTFRNCDDLSAHMLQSCVRFGVITEEFLSETKPEVEQFAESIRTTFAKRLRDIDWIDDVTRYDITQKLQTIKMIVGAPDWVLNDTKVIKKLLRMNIRNDTFLDNLIQIEQNSVLLEYTNASETDDKLNGIFHKVNAYFNEPNNMVVIPWSILNTPFYYLGLQSLNYGALGYVVGHEILHGFETTSQLETIFGYSPLWNEISLRYRKTKSQCFIKQYGNISISIQNISMEIDSRKSLDENIADNGGLKMAFYALKENLKSNGPELKLPGLTSYTSEQLFFLSFGHMYCSLDELNVRKFVLYHLIGTHLLEDDRVNAALRNSQEFADAFKCPVGSLMNPEREKCDMW